MNERDDFDKIVEGLELDFTFPDEPADPTPDPQDGPAQTHDDMSFVDHEAADGEEPFYRKVDPVPLVPKRRGVRVAWAGVIGAPLLIVLASLANMFLSRGIIAAAALTFVASAIYLFLQLPEHGPSRRDWPDDGAVL